MKTPQSSFHMGKRCIIMQLSYLNPTLPIFIDDDSGIGGHCLLFTHGSWNSQLEGFPVKFAPIHLGKKVWLPWRVFIMPGVTVGDNVVVGANSMLNSDLPSNCIAAGSPAKIIKENVPTQPAKNEKDKVLKNIFDEFFNYLRYEDFTCDVQAEDNGFIATIQGKRSGAIHYVLSPLMHIKGDSGSVVIFDSATPAILQEAIESGYGMAVSINNGMRIGSNASGEELLAFFSRYGVRFSRLD
ncbi:MAG: acyltransferase [Bacteroidetes bacterium]|nr:MAG: acyltransferase [Bacteroidota bacterium]